MAEGSTRSTSRSIYGSRGANGVVIITTKQGAARAPKVTLDTYTHLFDQAAHAADIRKLMANSEFGRLLHESPSHAAPLL